MNKLALTITYPACSSEYQELVKNEWNEFEPFLEENKINCCYWAEDEIPKDILLTFFDFLLVSGYHSIKIGYWPVFDEQVETHQLTHQNKYDSAVRFAKNNFVLSPDDKFCLKLPYHDLPYTFLLTNNLPAKEIAAKLGYEGFEAEKETKTYWHVE